MKHECYCFRGEVEVRRPISAFCLVTHEAIRYDELRIKLPDGRGFIRVKPFLTREKRWLIDNGFAVGRSLTQVRSISTVKDLVDFYQKQINRRHVKAAERKRLREVLLLCGCQRVEE